MSPVRRHLVIQGESININQILRTNSEDVLRLEELWLLAQTLKRENIRQQTVTANEVSIYRSHSRTSTAAPLGERHYSVIDHKSKDD